MGDFYHKAGRRATRDCHGRWGDYPPAMRVWIIGCGYVGTALGRRLVAEGHEVTGVCRTAGNAEELQANGIRPALADITRPEELQRLPVECDHAVLCAASAGGDAEAYRRVYVDGTRNVLNWLAAAPLKRLVYTGSTGVYGQTDGSDVDEDSTTEPPTATAKVLREAEELLLRAAAERRVPAVLFRVAGIYGPDRGHWLKSFLAGSARMDGDGSRFLNMIHRDDLVDSVLAALERGKPGCIYNVADDEPVRQRDLFAWLADRLDRPLPPPAETSASAGGKGRGGSRRILNRRLREELGVTLRFPTFREGFESELARLGR